MPALKKATLQEISGDSRRSPVGDPVEVQFNPTTLHLQLSNQIEGGETRGRTARQFVGANAAVLTLDLVFDSADEGTTERPVSVREKTAIVERYVLPQQPGGETPPKLRFQWAELVIEGIVDSVGIDFDHFASDGTPLRAKVSLSIREQDPRYQYLQAGPGSRNSLGGGIGFGASVGFGASIGIGASVGIGASIGGGFGVGFEAGASFGAGFSGGLSGQAAFALEGESAVELATRLGLDPGAWRGLDVDLSGGVGLAAGTEVGFDARLAAGPGLGASAGFEAGAGASLESSFGLEGSAVEPAAGFALAAAGGVSAAVASVQTARAEESASAARNAFKDPGAATPLPAAPARPAPPQQPRTPLRIDGVPTPARQAAAAPAPPPPTADPRAITYGSGVPLRPRFTGAAEERTKALPPTQTKGGHRAAGACNCGCSGRGGRR